MARGSWFVKAHHHSEWAVVKYHSGPPSHGRPFWQPSCAFRWSAPDGPKRLSGRPLRTRPIAVFFCGPHSFPSPVCDIVGDAQRASRYALRASRSVVVSLRLSRRYAASESEPVMYVVYITFQAGRPSGRPLRATSHELRTTKKALEFSSAFFIRISGFLSSQGASPQVLSAFAGLTAVFGMGTGGSP